MAFQAVPDTAECRFHLQGRSGTDLEGVPWYFRFHVRDESAGAWGPTELSQLRDYGLDWWETGKDGGASARSLVNGGFELVAVRATDLQVENGNFSEGAPTNPIGNRAGSEYTPSAPALVQFSGDPGGMPKRGRIFWSGLTETDIIADRIGDGARTALAGCVNGFISGISDPVEGGNVAWACVLVSRNADTIPDPTPRRIAVRRVTAVTNTLGPPATVRAVISAQRNRREGH